MISPIPGTQTLTLRQQREGRAQSQPEEEKKNLRGERGLENTVG